MILGACERGPCKTSTEWHAPYFGLRLEGLKDTWMTEFIIWIVLSHCAQWALLRGENPEPEWTWTFQRLKFTYSMR